MKTKSFPILIQFLALFLSSSLVAQVPQGIPYQAMIRGNDGAALVNANVTVRFTLHQNTTTGPVEYQETQALTTNAYGLINTQFGIGTPTQGTFAGIVWSNTSKFIQVEANDGNGYLDMGTQQMMSVPYAMYAGSAGQSIVPLGTQTGDMLYWDSGTETWMALPSGNNGQALYNCDGVPTWGGCAPIVGNLTVSGITPYTAYAEFPMSSNGGNAPTSIGFYLSTSSNVSPSNGQFLGGTWPGGGISNWINSNNAAVPGGSGTIKSGNDGATSISSLSPNTQYYIIGAVSNAKGTTVTAVMSFNTPVLVEGCMESGACNYNPSANFNMDCQYPFPGFTCDGACETDADNDGICDFEDSFICNSDIDDDGVCDNNALYEYIDVDGCTDINACNYNMHYIYEGFGSTQCYYDTDQDGYCPVPPSFPIPYGFTFADWEDPTVPIYPPGGALDYSATNLDFCQDLNACNVVGNGDLFGTILFQENGDMDWQDVGLLNSFEFDTYESSFMTVELWLTGNSGMFVDRFGCAYDSDNDGICDVSDKCHDMSACNYLNTNDEYCFPDTDVDGVCDNLDGCYAVSACNYLDPVTSICSYASDVCDDGNNNTLDDVFDTNCICSGNFTLEIGQTYQGGSIAYIFQSSDPGYVEGEIHGLIASDFDIGVFNWGCYGVGFENYDIPGAEGFILGTGAQNTIDIVNAGCGGAAQACADLELNGYSDWFLPSIMELNLLWQNRYLIGGFQDANYWSSTEEVSWGAMYFMFGLGGPGDSETNEFYLVRPIRVF